MQKEQIEQYKSSGKAYESERNTLHRTISALEDANVSRQQMAEGLKLRNIHLEQIIQQGEQAIAAEKVQLAKETMEYASNTAKGLGVAFGERFMDCFNEVQKVKEQNAELKIQIQDLEEQVEAEKYALVRATEDGRSWHTGLVDVTAKLQDLQTANRKLETAMERRDKNNKRLED